MHANCIIQNTTARVQLDVIYLTPQDDDHTDALHICGSVHKVTAAETLRQMP